MIHSKERGTGYTIARAAAWDAGNRSMRAAGRTTWNKSDYNAAVAEFARLWPPDVVSVTPAPAEPRGYVEITLPNPELRAKIEHES